MSRSPALFVVAVLALSLLVLPGAAPGARAQSIERGLAAYEAEDYAGALAQWRPLAWQGNAAAQYGLGVLYDRGRGVGRDDAAALGWYRRAAAQGVAEAEHALGVFHAAGRGVAQSHVVAAEWYRRAAERGYADSQLAIGILHQLALGVPEDAIEAFKWFDIAAVTGREEAAVFREEVAAQMTPAQIAEADRRAQAWQAAHGQSR